MPTKQEFELMLSDTQLEQMVPHLEYEIDEFRRSLKDLPGTRDKPEWNRTLESVLLHFRVLRAFFFSEGTKPDSDVFASDYVPGWKPVCDPVFGRTKVAIDKTVAHLTIERLRNASVQWRELDAMNTAIERLILDFKNALPTARKKWFVDLDAGVVVVSLGQADNSTASFGR